MRHRHRRRTPGMIESRTRRPARPNLEALEGRALMAVSALDPTFGQGGLVLGPVVSNPTANVVETDQSLAVQSDGKIIVLTDYEAIHNNSTPYSIVAASLVMKRYNADGSLDTTFGTAGVVNITAPSPYNDFGATTSGIAVGSDGSIVFAANLEQFQATGSFSPTTESIVYKLTSAGQFDTTFGTAGEATIPAAFGSFSEIAVGSDGTIVAAGNDPVPDANTPGGTDDQISLVRLTATGAVDTTFNSTGHVDILPASAFTTSKSNALGPIALGPGGQVYVLYDQTNPFGGGDTATMQSFLTSVTAAGAVDSTFGTGGTVAASAALGNTANAATAIAVQTNGDIVLAGDTGVGTSEVGLLTRLLPTGAADPSFVTGATGTTTTGADTGTEFDKIVIGPTGEITVGGSSSTRGSSAEFLQYQLLVERYQTTGALDTSFGDDGRLTQSIAATAIPSTVAQSTVFPLDDIALTPAGKVVAALTAVTVGPIEADTEDILGTQSILAQLLPGSTKAAVGGDYDGDGKSDIAAELAAFGLFAIRRSDGAGDLVESFGPAGVGGAIPAPGDYDGDGKTDVAAYLPAYGVFVYRPSSGGADVVVSFGTAGAGNSIPAPGDYDGDGKTDVAVYLPSLGILAYRPSSGGSDVLASFGIAGAGNSIPAPGDYDGDGKTDVAVYLPTYGILAYRPSAGGADVLTQFGSAGAGQSIPAPGDYDGDGKTDVAIYLPTYGILAYRPSSGGADVLTQFGTAGSGQSVPAPGDYDGDGKTDVAVYLPSLGDFAYRPSSGGSDVVEPFGVPGTGLTVPASSIAAATQGVGVSGAVVAQAVPNYLPMVDEAIDSLDLAGHKKKTSRLSA